MIITNETIYTQKRPTNIYTKEKYVYIKETCV